MASAKATIDHDEIRRWVESRGGFPAHVKRTASSGNDPGVLRIDYPGYSGADSLERIDWDQWFDWFDRDDLAFLYQAQGKSRFSKLVDRKSVEVSSATRSGRRTPAKRSSSAKRSGSAAAGKRSSAKRASTSKRSATASTRKASAKKPAKRSASTKRAAGSKTSSKRTSTRTTAKRSARATASRGAATKKRAASPRKPSASRSTASRSSSRSGNGHATARRSTSRSTSGRTSRSANRTTDHDEIRSWVEARGGFPARVKRSGRKNDPGILRIDYPGFSGTKSLERIGWDEWFDWFDRDKLAFLYQGVKNSRFSKLVRR